METTQDMATTQVVRTFLAEDSKSFRDRLSALITVGGEVSVIGEAATVERSIKEILALHPEVVVLDIHLQDGNSMRVIREVKKQAPDIEFVVLTNHPDPLYRMAFAKLGASGFLDKSHDFANVKAAILSVAHSSRAKLDPVTQH